MTCVALAAACAALAATAPADAAWPFPPPRNTTTTTTRPTTTTTGATTTTTAPTTTTTAPTTTTTAPTTTTTDPTAPCGGSLPKAGGGTWQCSWSDEFDGTSLDRTKWLPQTTAASGFNDKTSCVVDSPNNLAEGNGVLTLTARKEAAPFTCQSPNGNYTTQYTSATVTTFGLFTQAYGRFEMRAKFPSTSVPGLQSAFWLWPENMFKYGYVWPQSGEIDVAEEYSAFSDRVIPYIHYVPATTDVNVTNNYCMVNDVGAFHTYTLEWTTSTLTVMFDGQTCIVDSWNPALPLLKPQPFDQPFMVALTQMLGQANNAFNASTTPLPASMDVDYVHVWK
jgi:beta-glucanase (GH16 family)